jgi:quercetin dioxygenase-like cupin family protein
MATFNGEEVHEVEQPAPFFYQTGNVFIKQIWLKKQGYRTYGHSHKHPHVSLLGAGSVRADVLDEQGQVLSTAEYHAPAAIEIAAGVHHKFTALRDDTMMYCVHDTHGLAVDDLGEAFVPPEQR